MKNSTLDDDAVEVTLLRASTFNRAEDRQRPIVASICTAPTIFPDAFL